MLAFNEARPFGPTTFGWHATPTTTMGLVPHMPPVPNWYEGTQYADWPYIIPWVVVFADSVAPWPQNSRVALRDMVLAYYNLAQGKWITLYGPDLPVGGQDHDAAFTATFPNTHQIESDGSWSYAPQYNRCAECWGSRQQFDISQIGGVFASVSHRIAPLNASGLNDRWLVQIGADYYPDLGPWNGVNPGVATGRIKRVMPQWRTTTMLLTDGSFSLDQTPPPRVITE